PLNLNNMMSLAAKGSPLDNYMYSLKVQMNNNALPDIMRKEAKNLLDKLQNPVDDLPSVSNWLNFTTGPLSPTSPQALALHQWAFLLLSIRFSQLGKSVDRFLKKSVDLMEDRFDSQLEEIKGALNKDGKKLISSLLDETLDQIARYQNPAKENLPLLYQYIPLPPTYDGGREGGFNARPVVEEDGKKSWHLSFVFDLKELGPIEIKAEAKLPELKLSVVASTFAGLQRVQECLPDLKSKLQDLGITTRSSTARMGKVHIRESEQQARNLAKKNDGSSLSVDI
ncbi:MAG: flagellar hook-length control protein FliK, partial [Succinivibrio sp.]